MIDSEGIVGGRPAFALPRVWRPVKAELWALVLGLTLALFSALFVVAGGPWIRLVAAGAAGALLVTAVLAAPGPGMIASFVYLVLLAFLRRALIGASPWISGDPMLLVGPFVAVVLILKAFVVERRPFAPDLLSRLVVLILLIAFVEVVNPDGGGVGAGIAGLMFVAVPLFWFFGGREYLAPYLDRLLATLIGLGCAVACYGLWQTEVGFPSWDKDWLQTAGANYNSLHVGSTIRSFATFSSFNEYSLFVGAALVASMAFVFRGRLVALLPVPLLAVALFLSSGRAPLVTALLGVFVMAGMLTGSPLRAITVIVLSVGIAFLALHFGASSLAGAASGSNSLVSHEIGGLTNPLDPNSSTLLTHIQEVFYGLKTSISHPFGQGTAVTNSASGLTSSANQASSAITAIGAGSKSTEVDLSNAFVSFGLPGGVLYLVTVLLAICSAALSYFRGRREMLAVVGIFVACLGDWQNGGLYAVSPLVWMLVGVVAAVAWERSPRNPASVVAAAATAA